MKRVIGSLGETCSRRLISRPISVNYIGSKYFPFVFNSNILGLRVPGSVGSAFVFSGIVVVEQLI
jgi:hypothetical protein